MNKPQWIATILWTIVILGIGIKLIPPMPRNLIGWGIAALVYFWLLGALWGTSIWGHWTKRWNR